MKQTVLSSADRQAAWERCRAWQEKKPLIKEDHDHDFKKNNSHDHDLKPLQKKPKDPSATRHAEKPPGEKLEGKALFRVVNQDPDFKQAIGWGLWPQALYNACMTYGVDRVRSAIHRVKDYTGVRNKAAYCMTVIKNPPPDDAPR